MKRLLLAAAAAVVLSTSAFAQTDVNPKPPAGDPPKPAVPPPAKDKIGTVDLTRIFDKWTKVKDFTDTLDAQKKSQEAELENIKKDLKEKAQMRDAPGVHVSIKRQCQLDIVQLSAKADFMMKGWNEMVKQMLDEGLAKFYDEIREEIAAYSAQNGFTLVFKVDTAKLGSAADMSHTDERMAQISLLFAHDGYDITDDILKRLDAKYAKEKAANPPKDGAGGNGGK